jgi:hypothetical protein
MRKLITLLALLLVFPVISASALTFSENTNVTLTALNKTITIVGISSVTDMTVGTNTLSFTAANGSSVTLRSTDKLTMSIGSGSVSSSFNCGSSYSQLTFTSTVAQTVDINVTSTVCTTDVVTGGGGGGGTTTTTTTTPAATTATGTATVTASVGGTASATTAAGTTATVTVPAQAVSASTNVTVTPTATTAAAATTAVAAVPATQSVVGSYVYDFVATSGTTTVSTFSQNTTITLSYTDAQISGLQEGTLAIYYYDTATQKWVALTSTVDTANNKVTAQTNHFTLFAIMGTKTTTTTATTETTTTTTTTKPISQMTTAELKAKIAEIQAQILVLLQELAKMQGVSTGAKFTSTLKLGMTSNEVKLLQQCLATDSAVYPEGKASGYFGTLTKAAVVRFQEKYASEILTPSGLTKGTGTVGTSTRAKLNAICP